MFLVFIITGFFIITVAIKLLEEDRIITALFMLALTILGILMFYSFTIEITKDRLNFWFGIGVVSKSIKLSEISSFKSIKNPWYYFWGIKSIPGGWIYAIAPGEAVELILRDGKIIQLGTKQSQQLIRALDAARESMNIAGTIIDNV